MAEIGVGTTNIIALTPLISPGPTTCELWRTLLYRAGQNPDTTQWGPAALHYLNRAYWALCRGGGEYEEGAHEDWHWLRKVPPGHLILEPEHSTAANGSTVNVVHGSQTIGVTIPPQVNCLGWQFRVLTTQGMDIFRVISHAPGHASLMIDAPYTGPTNSAASYWLRNFEYPLASDLMHLIQPLHTDRIGDGAAPHGEIRLTSHLTLTDQWPRDEWSSGIPDQCAIIGVEADPSLLSQSLPQTAFGTRLIRFNRCPNAQTGQVRVEYSYSFLPPLLTQTSGACDEVPLAPPALRWTIVDLALYQMFFDMNDNRADGAVILGKQGIRFAQRELRHQMAVSGSGLGTIRPRGRRDTLTGNRWRYIR